MEPVQTSSADPQIQFEVVPSKNSELMAKIKKVAGVILAVLGALLLCAGMVTFFLPLVSVATSLLACGMVSVSVGTYFAFKKDEDPILNNNLDLEVVENN